MGPRALILHGSSIHRQHALRVYSRCQPFSLSRSFRPFYFYRPPSSGLGLRLPSLNTLRVAVFFL